MNAGHQPLVPDEEERETRRLVNAPALGLDDAVLDLIRHAEAVTPANPVGLLNQPHRIVIGHAVDGNRPPLLEPHRHDLRFDADVVTPERHPHDRLDD